jgi:hypothetical protein
MKLSQFALFALLVASASAAEMVEPSANSNVPQRYLRQDDNKNMKIEVDSDAGGDRKLVQNEGDEADRKLLQEGDEADRKLQHSGSCGPYCWPDDD